MSVGPDIDTNGNATFASANLDIVDPDSYLDGFPHATFRRLRDEQPLSWWPEHDGGKGFWAVTRYEDLLYVSQHVELFSSAQGVTLEEIEGDDFELRRNMLEYDPPEHTRYRRLVSKPFSRREVYGYEDGIRGLARDVVLEAAGTEQFDYTELIAKQLPMRMLGRMLGVPDVDGDWLVIQGDALLGNLDPEMTDYAVGYTDTDQFKHIPFRSPAALELYKYAEKQAELRRECPGNDLISALLAPTIDGERLTDLQFKNLFVLMISAGNDTTRYTMAGGLKALCENPAQFQTLRQACIDGDTVTVDRAVEEVLRWTSVTMHFRRTATQDIEMHGQTIRKGDKVLEWFSSANYDERQFEDPFRFDIHRWPNDHVAFNLRSPHLCLGAQLARMELKLLFQELLPRISAVEVAGPIERLRSNFICGMKHLPVNVAWV
ncbi:MAG TPA: cytochrome P450 [Ilumatobacteraceae bacterium]|nr:cytochrome P450 [Ilumatobacteraceae bacterium]HRB01824.1 cytochrome P450 [Ilumatobacteraceae bacterium]